MLRRGPELSIVFHIMVSVVLLRDALTPGSLVVPGKGLAQRSARPKLKEQVADAF